MLLQCAVEIVEFIILSQAWVAARCRRHYCGKQEGDVEVPDVVMTALVWGLFMGVSSNLRYQVRLTCCPC